MATLETEPKCGMTAVPASEHRWLHRLVGERGETLASECPPNPAGRARSTGPSAR